MRRYRVTLFVIALVVINVLGLSFTFVSRDSYKSSLYYRFTRQRFAWLLSDPHPKYTIQAGWAKVTISPSGASSTSRKDSIQTRALVLDNGTTRAVMITVDLPMMPPTVAQALEKRLPKLGFAWKNVYLGATYSQSDPGGWASDYMGQQKMGTYNEQRVNQLTEAILKAVTVAQQTKETVQIRYTKSEREGQKQLSSGGGSRAAEPVYVLQLRKQTGQSALICSGLASENSTDSTNSFYSLAQELEKQTHSFTLGLVGSILDAGQPGSVSQKDPAALAAQLTTLLDRQPFQTDSTLVAQTTPLIQNDPHIRVSQYVRLKPWLAKALYGDYPAELKALRIGQTVFVGCPGGVSAELGNSLLNLPVAAQRQLVITSYNGGNLGQIVPDKYYYAENSPYAIGQINRFGPHTAEFFNDITQSLVSSLK
ncbi:neutral/alkaline non-lysosomal ceramidase N-terminal domain-containing protein [Spirosoma pollinicola]|uniref:Neutral/alkaline non-lysosomal ceramidase N-terminal domain-containing protein n=1 Tax=Spirosoma pollinicola TaxID=2057025 RepID=A0A2K8Z3Q3_9BACT|nr:neutral/alkaline non-lysosomal ceramidase N-terminal domain-containing protein [Spirosoma pollinicola]AUD04492.1 hypothetical protein CWM47_23175 [Spirosoma pollinicola]